jgi:hypothetical protein
MLQTGLDHQISDHLIGTLTKKIDANAKNDHIECTRQKDPLPEFVAPYEVVGLHIRLNGYDKLFQQSAYFYVSGDR